MDPPPHQHQPSCDVGDRTGTVLVMVASAVPEATAPSCPIQAAVETAAAIVLNTPPPSNSTANTFAATTTATTRSLPDKIVLQSHPSEAENVHVAGERHPPICPSRSSVGGTTSSDASSTAASLSQTLAVQPALPYSLPQQQHNRPVHLRAPVASCPVAAGAAPFPGMAFATSGLPVQPIPNAVIAAVPPNFPVPQNATQTPYLAPGMMFLPYAPMVNGTAPPTVAAAALSGGQVVGNSYFFQQPQIAMPPIALPQSLPYPVQAQMLKRRAGKWSSEEEDYAAILIEMFEKGQVMEEKNGVTLRSFLSRKLFCAPMRISKKYAGKGIGKKVFMSKINPPFFDPQHPHPKEFYVNLARMKDAELRFMKVDFPELYAMLFPFVPGPFVSGAPIHVTSNGSTAQPALTVAPTLPQPIAPKIDTSLASHAGPRATNITQQTPLPTQHPPEPLALPTGAATAGVSGSSLFSLQTPARKVAPDLSKEETGEKQDSTCGSRPRHGQSSQTATDSTSPLCSSNSTTSAERLCLPSPHATESPATKEPSAVQRLHEAYLNSILKKATSVTVDKDASMESKSGVRGDGKTTETGAKISTPRLGATSLHRQDGMPDFLSGFDKVSGHKSAHHHPPIGDFDPYSPTYTTESFDDLHQLLGKNLTPLTAGQQSQISNHTNNEIVTKPVIPQIQTSSSTGTKKRIPQSSLQMRPLKKLSLCEDSSVEGFPVAEYDQDHSDIMPRSSNLNHSADAYSIFAQESAQASRQNSAYFQGHQINHVSHQTYLQAPRQGFATTGILSNESSQRGRSLPFTSARATPVAVSDRSDLASDDVNSGNESGNFGDSDETHSEGSNRRKKKDEMEGDDDDVRSWYKTLVQD